MRVVAPLCAAVGLLRRELWSSHVGWRAVAATLIASAVSCGGETVAPNSQLTVSGLSSVFELDSVQFVAVSRGRTLKAGEVTWSMGGNGLATVSANGLVKAIRATDIDVPFDGTVPAQPNLIARAGTDTAYGSLHIHGWERPHVPAFAPVAYVKDERYFNPALRDGITFQGVTEGGVLIEGAGSLILTCGTVVPGHWTVEIGVEVMDTLSLDPTSDLFSKDTVSVAFDDEVRRLERWQRLGNRLRAVDGDDMVRRMLRARRFAMTAHSYFSDDYPYSPGVYDGVVDFSFRLGNVKQVTQARMFRACN